MRRPTIVAIVLTIVTVACGGGEADVCTDIADEFVSEMQAMLDVAADFALDDVPSEAPAGFAEIEARLDALDNRADDEGCQDDPEVEAYLRSKVKDLKASGPIAESILEDMQSDFGG